MLPQIIQALLLSSSSDTSITISSYLLCSPQSIRLRKKKKIIKGIKVQVALLFSLLTSLMVHYLTWQTTSDSEWNETHLTSQSLSSRILPSEAGDPNKAPIYTHTSTKSTLADFHGTPTMLALPGTWGVCTSKPACLEATPAVPNNVALFLFSYCMVKSLPFSSP